MPRRAGSHGVMVSTLDSESSDPSSNLGGTCFHDFCKVSLFDIVAVSTFLVFLKKLYTH